MTKMRVDWIEYLVGALSILLGIVSLKAPAKALDSYLAFFVFLLFLYGIADVYFAFCAYTQKQLKGALSLFIGICDLVIGVFLLFEKFTNVWAITFWFPVWFTLHCILYVTEIDLVKFFSKGYSIVLAVINMIGIAIGIILMLNPWVSIIVLVYYVGIYLIILGTGRLLRFVVKI